MAKYQTFTYGSGILYGVSALLDALEADSGPSSGGEPFTLRGSGLEDLTLNDDFSDVILDPARWTDISSGSGSVSTGSGNLSINTGSTAGSVGGIESVQAFYSTQWEASLTLPPVINLPSSEVDLFKYELYVDASNYCSFSIVQSDVPDEIKLRISVVVSGNQIANQEIDWSSGIATLKILRWGTHAYFYANGSLLFNLRTFVSDPATLRFTASNNSADYDIVNSTLRSATLRPYLAFNNQVVHDLVVVSDRRARGITPPSIDERDQPAAYQGFVDITYIGVQLTTKLDFYEYYYESALTVLDSEQFDIKLSVIGDPIVRTPVDVTKGL